MRPDGVLAVFADPAGAARAVAALKAAGHADVRAAMPAPFPELVEALARPRSVLDKITLSGALFGVASGFALCIGTALAWPLVTGGKPIVSLPPFVIIAFELAVLIGALVNLATLAVLGGRGRHRHGMPADPRFSHDRVGVFVAGAGLEATEALLREHGAEEVRHVA